MKLINHNSMHNLNACSCIQKYIFSHSYFIYNFTLFFLFLAFYRKSNFIYLQIFIYKNLFMYQWTLCTNKHEILYLLNPIQSFTYNWRLLSLKILLSLWPVERSAHWIKIYLQVLEYYTNDIYIYYMYLSL